MNSDLFEFSAILYRKVKADRRTATLIASLAGVSQPTVSRIKSGKPGRSRGTESFNKLCRFYGIEIPVEPQRYLVNNRVILNAVMAVWDGTDEHANALAQVILSLRGIMKPAVRKNT